MYEQIVFLGHLITLYLPEPNWASRVQIGVSLQVDVDEANSAREDRRPRHEALRHTFSALFTLSQAEAASLHANAANPRTKYVGCPLFPDKLLTHHFGQSVWNAQFYINWDETGYNLYAAADVPASPPKKWTAPLLVGRLNERPKLTLLTDLTAEFQLKFTERSPWEFRLTPKPISVGADWPEVLQPNWVKDPQDWSEDDVKYINLGDSRTEGMSGGESAPRRFQSALFTLRGREQLRILLNFFLARKGRHQSFLCPWLFRPANDSPETPYQVKVRFAANDLKLEFITDELVNVQITFAEVPWELDPIEGEDPDQPAVAYLYRFQRWTPSGYVYWRYTAWERNIVRSEGPETPITPKTYFANRSIEHDAISGRDDLSTQPVTVTVAMGDCPPLQRLLQRKCDTPIEVHILRCDPNNVDATAVRKYVGEIVNPRLEDGKIIAPSVPFAGLLESKVPAFQVGPKCNYDFCSAGCTKNMAAIRCTGTIASVAGLDLFVTMVSNPGSIAFGADAFAGGTIDFGTFDDHEIRHVVRSAAIAGGQIKFTLKRAFITPLIGATVNIEPTCTGSREECINKWANYINFGGHPHIGSRNLSLPVRDMDTPVGKK